MLSRSTEIPHYSLTVYFFVMYLLMGGSSQG